MSARAAASRQGPDELDSGRAPPALSIGLFTHLALLWGLRVRTALNRSRGAAGSLPAVAAGLGFAVGSGIASAFVYAVLTYPTVAASPAWSRFFLRLVLFLVACVWATWSILTAGVDEHAELSRFATFPVRPFRLYLASILSGLVEPRSLMFYPVIGAALWGYAAARPFPIALALPAAALTAVLNLAWARVGLNLALNVLRHRRSAEIMGGGFLVALLFAAYLPPLDASQLKSLAEGFAGAAAVDDTIVLHASNALGGLPPCKLAETAIALSLGDPSPLVRHLVVIGVSTLVALALAYALLLRFYRHTARGEAPSGVSTAAPRRPPAGGTYRVLFERELADLVLNPKARLLLAVPFFLAIVMRLISARALAWVLAGAAADVWLMGAIVTYASLMAMNFAQNAFAYDGHGLARLYAAPVPLRAVLVAKNLALFASSGVVALLLCAFYVVYLHPAEPAAVGAVLLAVASQVPVLVACGNFLSSLAPRKYHASLRRRDRAPIVSTAVGFLAAVAAVAPSFLVLRALGQDAAGPAMAGLLSLAAAAAVVVYLGTLPAAARLLERRREQVLQAITRE